MTRQEFEKLTELAARCNTSWIFDYYMAESVIYFKALGYVRDDS